MKVIVPSCPIYMPLKHSAVIPNVVLLEFSRLRNVDVLINYCVVRFMLVYAILRVQKLPLYLL